MSRQIKFRAWVKSGDYSEMLSNVQNHIGAATGFGHLLQGTAKGIDESHVMQFTGLTDKNGVDIYESDVVLFNDCFIAQVKYMGCAFAVITKSIYANRDFDFHLIDAFESVEVIGNIYQNPELLEQSK